MNSSVQQPMIVKYVESLHNGIQSQALSRYAIGYILRGTKYIYDGDKRQTLSRGDVFYLGQGLVQMIDSAAMERSVTPELGANIDLRL